MRRARVEQTNAISLPLAASFHLQPRFLSTLRRRLLDWFDQCRRNLPWRENRDPYRIWVSEVMLQQTQVVTVIPYFQRFLQAFPSARTLAAADESDVLRLWEGLGYYRRARDLHRAAQILVRSFPGELPDDPDVWRQLPGIGRYILGAVLSQAFDRRLPIVEANSKRVLSRLFGQVGDPTTRTVIDWLWQTAASLLPRNRAGDFNQALMELGALVCLPATPRCSQCPLSKTCVAHRDGTQDSIPARPARPPTEEIREVALIPWHRGRLLLLRRPAKGRWANMWEFPRVEVESGETDETAARRVGLDVLGIDARVGAHVRTIRHAVTRFRITLAAYEARFHSRKVRLKYHQEACWLFPDELANLPVSRPQRLLANVVAENAR